MTTFQIFLKFLKHRREGKLKRDTKEQVNMSANGSVVERVPKVPLANEPLCKSDQASLFLSGSSFLSSQSKWNWQQREFAQMSTLFTVFLLPSTRSVRVLFSVQCRKRPRQFTLAHNSGTTFNGEHHRNYGEDCDTLKWPSSLVLHDLTLLLRL